ncbi:nitroreductase family protein [Streptomyces abyssomicinicus]|uniref:nitroreductase family protein n=1 Tax=Streptomyces abyssomicinicus TaxID=574929 RepID=UPI00124FF4CF|nr:nitroreductase family protein [Streptomyces abyssomicinicus]
MSLPLTEQAVSVHPLLAGRWSPRSFDATHTIGDEELLTLLEAARWAPSAGNSQPWRFLVGRRGDSTYQRILGALRPGNQSWADRSSLLLAAVAAELREDGTPHHDPSYDTALAVAQLAVQSTALGLHAHQMGGFDPAALSTALNIPDDYRPLSVTAVGALAPADLLPEELRVRETATRERRPLAETFFAGSWGDPLRTGQDG